LASFFSALTRADLIVPALAAGVPEDVVPPVTSDMSMPLVDDDEP